MAFYSDIADIKAVFFQKSMPEWELYNGKIKNRPTAERKVPNLINANQSDDIDSSWVELEEALNMVSSKGGNAMLFLGPIDESPKFAIPIRLSTQTMTRQKQTSSGITGYNTGMQSTLEDKMKIYDLSRRLEDMEQAQVGGFWERVGDRVADQIDPNTLVSLVTTLISAVTGKIAPQQQETPIVTGMQDSDSDGNEGILLQSAVENMVGVLSSNMNSEKEIADFLNKMAGTVKNNPDILKQLR